MGPNAASRPVRSDVDEARPGAQHDTSVRAEAHRTSQADGRSDGGAGRGLVFGAALSAGLLGYRAARALQDFFRTEAGLEEEEVRRRRAQEAADAALAARLQREEQAAFAREQASRARPRPPTNAFDAFVTRRDISLGPFGVIRVETTSSARAPDAPTDHASASASSAHRNAVAVDDLASAHDALFAAALGAAQRARGGAFAGNPPTARSRGADGAEADLEGWLAHRGVFDAFRGLEGLEGLESFESFEALLAATLRGEGAGRPRESGAGDEALARMPTRVFSKKNARKVGSDAPPTPRDETPTCAICMCDAEEGDTLRRLPCGHEFHQNCVDRWLTDHRTCPMCKSDVVQGARAESSENRRSATRSATPSASGRARA